MIATDDELLNDVKYWKGRCDALEAQLDSALEVLTGELVEIVAIGLCAKSAIEMGGPGHGRWWELGDDAKGVFRGLARVFLADHSRVNHH